MRYPFLSVSGSVGDSADTASFDLNMYDTAAPSRLIKAPAANGAIWGFPKMAR